MTPSKAAIEAAIKDAPLNEAAIVIEGFGNRLAEALQQLNNQRTVIDGLVEALKECKKVLHVENALRGREYGWEEFIKEYIDPPLAQANAALAAAEKKVRK